MSLRHLLAFDQVRSRAEGVLGRGVDYEDARADEERVCGVFMGGEGVRSLCSLLVEADSFQAVPELLRRANGWLTVHGGMLGTRVDRT